MAKLTITIEDISNGRVSIKCDPNFQQMMKMNESGFGLTAAHGYALLALNEIQKESKKRDPKNIIQVPRLR